MNFEPKLPFIRVKDRGDKVAVARKFNCHFIADDNLRIVSQCERAGLVVFHVVHRYQTNINGEKTYWRDCYRSRNFGYALCCEGLKGVADKVTTLK